MNDRAILFKLMMLSIEMLTRSRYHLLLALWGLCALASCFFALNTLAQLTGYVIVDSFSYSYSFALASILFIVALIGATITRAYAPRGLESMVTPSDIEITSSVKSDPHMLRIARSIGKNQRIQSEINHLLKELAKGNHNPGTGNGTLELARKVHYLRGRNGARVFYLQQGGNKYEIIGYSDKLEEAHVARYLTAKYRR